MYSVDDRKMLAQAAEDAVNEVFQVHIVDESDKWKYLREHDKSSSFDLKRHTTLAEYLAKIFPGNEFVFDKIIPKDIIVSRGGDQFPRYRPDARCEELNLVVEFDGMDHYMKASVMINDVDKDNYLKSLGYNVVRIPYWLQLSNDNIYKLFGVEVDEEMCTLDWSFYDSPNHGIDICLGGMCNFGRRYFVTQFRTLPRSTRAALIEDIRAVAAYGNGISDLPEDAFCPNDIFNELVSIHYRLRNICDDCLEHYWSQYLPIFYK